MWNMSVPSDHIAFGPVPSRRLGRSLGINNIGDKTCSYSCVYCQVGPTSDKSTERRAFFDPETIFDATFCAGTEHRQLEVRVVRVGPDAGLAGSRLDSFPAYRRGGILHLLPTAFP